MAFSHGRASDRVRTMLPNRKLTGETMFRRAILSALTAIAGLLVLLSLASSWDQPQIQGKLELYQTNTLLRAAEWQLPASSPQNDENPSVFAQAIVGRDARTQALKQYRSVRDRDRKNLEKIEARLLLPQPGANRQDLAALQVEGRRSLAELDVRIGILQALLEEEGIGAAQQTWNDLVRRFEGPSEAAAGEKNTNASASLENLKSDGTGISRFEIPSEAAESVAIARVLIDLWQDPPQPAPQAEIQLQESLEGWFRDRALTRLYEIEGRDRDLAILQQNEAQKARSAFANLAVTSVFPGFVFLVGTGFIIFLLVRRWTKKESSRLAADDSAVWEIPWDWETVWQVFVVGFLTVGQILIPLLVASFFPVDTSSLSSEGQAIYFLVTYLLLAGGGLAVLYLSLRPFLPLPAGWFELRGRGNWLLWGIGGYFVAFPLTIAVSLVNQQFWQGQGGSNPILQIALENDSGIALLVFALAASVAAPLYEEIMFRGFILPSLTRYVSVPAAIAISSILFALAHLNLSEVAPLATLGAVLGTVYTRSRGLLAPILLHAVWNGVTLASLYALGSGAS